jgi:hypothetical protein
VVTSDESGAKQQVECQNRDFLSSVAPSAKHIAGTGTLLGLMKQDELSYQAT